MTQERLAFLIGTTQDRVSRWESGACRPDLDHLAELVVSLKTRISFELRGALVVVGPAETGTPITPTGDAPVPVE